MGSCPVLLGGHQHQPQHPVHPFQLRHLRYFFQFFALQWQSEEADLFEKDKVASDPVSVIKLPAAEHWANACLKIKIPLLVQIQKIVNKGVTNTSCLKSKERRGVLVTKSIILKVLLYALKAAILKLSVLCLNSSNKSVQKAISLCAVNLEEGPGSNLRESSLQSPKSVTLNTFHVWQLFTEKVVWIRWRNLCSTSIWLTSTTQGWTE